MDTLGVLKDLNSDLLESQRNRLHTLQSICCCPFCHSALSWHEAFCICDHCHKQYPFHNSKIFFHSYKLNFSSETRFNFSLLENNSSMAKLINMGRKYISSEYRPDDQFSELLLQASKDSLVIECGSGNRRLNDQIITIDLHPFDNVDLIADIIRLPFENESVDTVILDTVLEHVEKPQQCVDEAFRVLKPGGRVICVTPFIFHYHPYPNHYWNFSEDGLKFLFRRFNYISVATDMGPTSGLINLISEYIAIAFFQNNEICYSAFKGLSLFFLFPFKYLDKLWCKTEKSKRIAMCLLTLAEK